MCCHLISNILLPAGSKGRVDGCKELSNGGLNTTASLMKKVDKTCQANSPQCFVDTNPDVWLRSMVTGRKGLKVVEMRYLRYISSKTIKRMAQSSKSFINYQLNKSSFSESIIIC